MRQEGEELITPEFDKREHRRAKLVTEVKCESLGKAEVLITRDVSVGGVFIKSSDPYPSMSKVTVTFRLIEKGPLVTCRGKVVYSIKGLGMGIQFDKLDQKARENLQKFVDEAA